MSNTAQQAAERAATMERAAKDAVKMLGGARKVAALYDLSVQAVYKWHQVPGNRVLEIEQATGGKVTRYEMRPDLFGESAMEHAEESSA